MVLPETTNPIRAAWVIFDRGRTIFSGSATGESEPSQANTIWHWCCAMQCRSKEREDMIVLPEKGVGRSAIFGARPVR